MAAQKKQSVPVIGDDGLTSVSSKTGTIRVTCTAAGLPVRMTIAAAAARRRPESLAREILALCRLAGTAAGVRTRGDLGGQGLDDETLGLLGLPSRRDLVAAEAAADACGRSRR
ncbi:hypothetical protein [Gordonia hydrophobica]|uniref:YbaB/EbfC DNA-binding family protein n=1 Tax=Gordonia hydrophobica TaxID=40516 RepID=A0ABZ2TWY3_9ACTN|nr:hypothetical protein [Gordonia hydrophobica]MBM7369354.1 hypothetical protein [Gordonia hydrophobica]